MSMLDHVILDILAFILVGAVSGFLSGLLGVGGGSVVVPTLAWLFDYFGFLPETVMHLAAGTSLAIISVAMTRTLLAHRRYHVEYWSIFRYWLLPIAMSAALGVLFAHYLDSGVLSIILAVVMVLIALKIFLPNIRSKKEGSLPGTLPMTVAASVIGMLSAMLGIGGGVFIFPYLSYFGLDMRRALVVSMSGSLTVSVVGSVAAILIGWHRPELPAYTIGYIYLPAWLGVLVGSLLCIPFGTRLSHRLPVEVLRKIFATVLLVIGGDLLLRFHG